MTTRYLNEIGLVPLLTADEERELAQIIEAGREAAAQRDAGATSPAIERAVSAAAAAKDRFIRANLRLVVSIAKRYPLPTGMELLDVIQEGNLGLEHAVDKFEWRRGFKFSTYATFWIRQAISRAINQKGSLIRLPEERAGAMRAALRQSGDATGLDRDMAELHRLSTPTSLDRPVGDDGDAQVADFVPDAGTSPEDAVLEASATQALLSTLDVLEPRARFAVEQRFGLADGRERSFREVGDELGVTAEAARRLVNRALDTVRQRAAELALAA